MSCCRTNRTANCLQKNHNSEAGFQLFLRAKLSQFFCIMIVVCKVGDQLQSCVPSWRADNPILVDVYIRGRPLAMNMTISLGIERVKFDLNKAGELLSCCLWEVLFNVSCPEVDFKFFGPLCWGTINFPSMVTTNGQGDPRASRIWSVKKLTFIRLVQD